MGIVRTLAGSKSRCPPLDLTDSRLLGKLHLVAPGIEAAKLAWDPQLTRSQSRHHREVTFVAHRAFFSFHYEEDVTRSSVVRNSEALKKQPSGQGPYLS